MHGIHINHSNTQCNSTTHHSKPVISNKQQNLFLTSSCACALQRPHQLPVRSAPAAAAAAVA
jgi:hypothetical protein